MKQVPPLQRGELWTNEAGQAIPANRITKAEKLREKTAHRIATQAAELSRRLADFKTYFAESCTQVVQAVLAELEKAPNKKGNYTWYNFDQSIRIECAVSEAIRFDEMLIEAAKEQLLKVISENISGDDFIKEIVIDAFQTTSGKLDTRRVLGLRRHTDKIKKKHVREQWEDAMRLIDRSVTRPESRTYYRVSVKAPSGEYTAINLDFATIKIQYPDAEQTK